jgi:hypothetical protein
MGFLPKFTNITLPHLRLGKGVKDLLCHRKTEILPPAVSGGRMTLWIEQKPLFVFE